MRGGGVSPFKCGGPDRYSPSDAQTMLIAPARFDHDVELKFSVHSTVAHASALSAGWLSSHRRFRRCAWVVIDRRGRSLKFQFLFASRVPLLVQSLCSAWHKRRLDKARYDVWGLCGIPFGVVEQLFRFLHCYIFFLGIDILGKIVASMWVCSKMFVFFMTDYAYVGMVRVRWRINWSGWVMIGVM